MTPARVLTGERGRSAGRAGEGSSQQQLADGQQRVLHQRHRQALDALLGRRHTVSCVKRD